jgi:hypothetical protein
MKSAFIPASALALIGAPCTGQPPQLAAGHQQGGRVPAANAGNRSQPPPPRHALMGPRRFHSGHFDRALLPEIRRQMARQVDFSDRFSTSGISCGIACYTYFLVDRSNGDVFDITEQLDVDLPNDSFDIDDLHTRHGSDIARVRFSNIRGDQDRCFTRSFRWVRDRFIPISPLRPIAVPAPPSGMVGNGCPAARH